MLADPLSVRCQWPRCRMPPGEMCGEMGPFGWMPKKRPHPSRVRLAEELAAKMAAAKAMLNMPGGAL